MIAGAFDDWNIKSKQNAAKNSPKDFSESSAILSTIQNSPVLIKHIFLQAGITDTW
jgi:hypothetical protein